MPNITERLKSAFSSKEIIFDSSISERNFNIWTIKKQNELILSAGDFNFEMFTNVFSGKYKFWKVNIPRQLLFRLINQVQTCIKWSDSRITLLVLYFHFGMLLTKVLPPTGDPNDSRLGHKEERRLTYTFTCLARRLRQKSIEIAKSKTVLRQEGFAWIKHSSIDSNKRWSMSIFFLFVNSFMVSRIVKSNSSLLFDSIAPSRNPKFSSWLSDRYIRFKIISILEKKYWKLDATKFSKLHVFNSGTTVCLLFEKANNV